MVIGLYIFPQDGKFNIMDYRVFELEIGKAVAAGRDVKVSVKPVYLGGGEKNSDLMK